MSKPNPLAQTSEDSKKVIVQPQTSRAEYIERKLDKLRDLLVEKRKKAIIAEVLLSNRDIQMFGDVLDNCTTFNKEVRNIAGKLAPDIVYRPPEAFKEELNLCRGECRAVIGQRLSDQLDLQAKNAASQTSKPFLAFVELTLAVFFMHFCVSEVRGSALDSDYSISVKHQGTMAQKTLTASSFKSALLMKLSNLLKAAAWGINSSDRRAVFENSVDPLYTTWCALRASVRKPLKSCIFKLSFPVINGSPSIDAEEEGITNKADDDKAPSKYVAPHKRVAPDSPSHAPPRIIETAKGDVHPVRGKKGGPRSKETATSHLEAVIGVIGIGVVAEVLDKATPLLKTVIHAQLVSEADLRNSLMGMIHPMPEAHDDIPSTSRGQPREDEQTNNDGLKRLRDHEQALVELEDYKLDLQTMIEQYHLSCKQRSDLQTENLKLKDFSQGLQLELNDPKNKFKESKGSSDVHRKDRKSLPIVISELIQKVDVTNEKIFQAAASLGRTLFRKKWEIPKTEAKKAHDSACNLIRTPIISVLLADAQNPGVNVSPFLIQVVLQALLTAFISRKVQLWASNEDEYYNYLDILDRRKQETLEDQDISGLLKTVTLAEITPAAGPWRDELWNFLWEVMAVASWKTRALEQRSMMQTFSPVFRAALDLRVSLIERFTPTDIKIGLIIPGSAFNNVCMDESYSLENPQQRLNGRHETVLATLGMGLHKVPLRNSSQDSDQYEVVLRPKVILESNLKIALDPRRCYNQDGKGD